MKRLKHIFGFMLVVALLLTTSITLTGCFKKEEKPANKIEVATTVLNNLKNYYNDLAEKVTTLTNTNIPELNNVDTSIFLDYGVANQRESFNTLDSNYLQYYTSNFGKSYVDVGLAILDIDNFKFDKFYEFDYEEDGVISTYCVSAQFLNNKLRFISLGSDEYDYYCDITEIYHINGSPISQEYYHIQSSDVVYQKIALSTHENIGFDYVVDYELDFGANPRIDMYINSELTREQVFINGDATSYSRITNIIQSKCNQVMESFENDMDSIESISLGEEDANKLIEKMFPTDGE